MLEEERNTEIERNNRLLYEKIAGQFQNLEKTIQCRNQWRKRKRYTKITLDDDDSLNSSKMNHPKPLKFRSRVERVEPIKESKAEQPSTLFMGKAEIDGLSLRIKLSLSKQRYLLLAHNPQLSI